MLATHTDRAPDAVDDQVDSLQLAWLLHQVEQRYAVELDLTDDELAAMSTVTGATQVLRAALGDRP